MRQNYFGTDGIRGLANKYPITPDQALRIGMAAGVASRRGSHRHRVVIGKDTRLSGYMIESALTAGFNSVGMDVFLLGPIPTPGVAMLTRSLRADLGLVISASHNPFHDNGIKLFDSSGFKLSKGAEQQIEMLLDSDLQEHLSDSRTLGRTKRIDGVHDRYVEYAKRTFPRDLSLDGLRVVLDCANGAGYRVAPTVLWELGAEVVPIGVEPNGFNINKDCGSTAPEALCAKVREVRADIGIALDGDADRVIIVDESGRVVDGDQLIAAIAHAWKEEGRLSAPGVVATIMSNLGLERYLGGLGLELIRTAVGDRNVSDQMRLQGYNLGGEQSGHIILSDYASTGDGLVAALQLLALVVRSGTSVSKICNRFESLPQVIRNIPTGNGASLESKAVQQAIAAGRDKLERSGRLVIRPSGTEPVIRVMAEGEDVRVLDEVVEEIVAAFSERTPAGRLAPNSGLKPRVRRPTIPQVSRRTRPVLTHAPMVEAG